MFVANARSMNDDDFDDNNKLNIISISIRLLRVVLGRKEGKEETRRRGLVVVFFLFFRKSILCCKKKREKRCACCLVALVLLCVL